MKILDQKRLLMDILLSHNLNIFTRDHSSILLCSIAKDF